MEIRNFIKPGGLILAPLAGYTDRFFRQLLYLYGLKVSFSEMISAEGLIRNHPGTKRYLLNINKEIATGVQLFGQHPEVLTNAAQIAVEHGAKMIDINMGCPVKKVVKSGAGAALMKNLPLARKIIAGVRKAVSIPLLIKCRTGWDENSINYLELAIMAEGEGVDALTLHPRTRSQNYQSPARWDNIKNLVDTVSIPVIGNGDITSVKDALAMHQETGCYAMMIGRAALRKPLIFQHYQNFMKTGQINEIMTCEDRWKLIDSHLTILTAELGQQNGIFKFRKFLSFYLTGLPFVSKIRSTLFTISTEDELRTILKEFLLSQGEYILS